MTRLLAGALLLLAAQAQAQAPTTAPAPPFEVAYRAWDVVTELARSNADPALSGACGKTFRPFVIPGLRMQNRQDQEAAAVACVAAARAACGNPRLRVPAESAKKCVEFR